MPRLKKEEVIKLYKRPYSMTPEEICKYADYFISTPTVKKYIKEGIESGKISEDDISAINEKQMAIQKEKLEQESFLKETVLKYVLTGKTRRQIIEELRDKLDINITPKKLQAIINEKKSQDELFKKQYDEILKVTRHQAGIKSRQTYKEKNQSQKEEQESER